MRRLLTLLFLAAVAVPAAAQDIPKSPRPPRTPRPPRDTTIERGFRYEVGPEGIAYQVLGRHGRLGVVVDLSADPSRDTVGALITAVTPGTPADKAGVRTGDIVVLMNGTRLAGADTSEHVDEDASRPGRRLVEMASKLHTGDTVRLELRRGGRPVNVTLVAGSGMEGLLRSYGMRIPSTREFSVPFEGGGMNFVFSGAPLANLELVKVNPGLADYFGTSEGVLVVNAPGDSTLGLRAGDVILSIGGRKPNSPSHAFRILGTYDPGETVPFELMRMKRRISVTGKMPAESGWRARHDSFNWDGLVVPGWDNLKLLRDWSETDVPDLFSEPRMQILKNPPQQMIIVAPRHLTVST